MIHVSMGQLSAIDRSIGDLEVIRKFLRSRYRSEAGSTHGSEIRSLLELLRMCYIEVLFLS